MNRRHFLRTAALAAIASPNVLTASPNPRTPAVRLDRDGTLNVAGHREFILGLYQPPKRDDALRAAHDAGFNLVNRPATRAAYDEAHGLGLWVWSAVGSIAPDKAEESRKRLRETIEPLHDHPALLFWETEDEPTFTWKDPAKHRVSAAQVNATAEYVRQLDPAHPLYLNHAPTHLVPTLAAYNPAADIVATDIYPVIPPGIGELYALWPDGRQGDLADFSLGQVGRYADKMRAVAGPHRAVFMVLQAFAWENLREKDRDPGKVLYPNAAQLRFMAWQSVVHGVNGILWWGLSYTAPESDLWDNLKTVNLELAQVRTALAAHSVKLPLRLTYHDTGHSLDRGIEWLAKPLGADTLLVAVNADPNPVEATFAGLGRFHRCETLFDRRPAALTPAGWRERIEPHGTRVWRLA
jgi:hypothetical protein